jgi:hypothetical protein
MVGMDNISSKVCHIDLDLLVILFFYFGGCLKACLRVELGSIGRVV